MTEPAEPSPEPAAAPAAAGPAAAPARRAPWELALAGLAGLAVGALTVGGVWLLTGSGDQVDTRPITGPDRLGPYVVVDQVDPAKYRQQAADIQKESEQNSRRLSESHGGAAALVKVYTDRGFQDRITVTVFRAKSPHPQYVPYEDIALSGVERPSLEIQTYGAVSCLVANDPAGSGRVNPDSSSTHTINCARTGHALTVEIQPNGEIGSRPHRLAQLVDEIWPAVS